MTKDYPSYRASGIAWMPKIPAHWETIPLKRSFRILSGATPRSSIAEYWDGDIVWITPADYKTQDKYIRKGSRNITPEGYSSCSTNMIPRGSIIFSKRAPIGTIAINDIELCTNQGCLSCIPLKNVSATYYYYLLSSFTDIFEAHASGSTFKEISATTFGNIKLPIPPREEQEQIVRFLDWKVSAIDKLIATKKHQLCSLTALNSTMEKNLVLLGFDAVYPKNPPSADWKENIPAHWKIRPLKRIFKILSGATPKSEIPEYWDGNIAWITPADYKTQDKYISHGSRNITEAGYSSCSTNMIPRGSIIFSKRAPIGTVAINDIELCTNQGCLSCIPIKDASATYYYYLMSCFTDIFEMNASGTTFKEISATTFGNMKVPFPPINEQKEIAAYLDAKHTKYARFAETTQKEIIVLNELKTRLISDTVTGKIDVRSIHLPNFAKEE